MDSIRDSSSIIHCKEVAGTTMPLPCPTHDDTRDVVSKPQSLYKSSDASHVIRDAFVDFLVEILQTTPRIPSKGLDMDYSHAVDSNFPAKEEHLNCGTGNNREDIREGLLDTLTIPTALTDDNQRPN